MTRMTIEEALKKIPEWETLPDTWTGKPWACPRCPAYLVSTLDGQHHVCVTRRDHGVYVIRRGVRIEVKVEPAPQLAEGKP